MYAGRSGIAACGAYLLSVGAAIKPADVSRPAAFSSDQRWRLISDHLLLDCRGVNFRAYRSLSRRLTRLSIHPKAERFANRVFVRDRIDRRVRFMEYQPDPRARRMMLSQPGPPLLAAPTTHH